MVDIKSSATNDETTKYRRKWGKARSDRKIVKIYK